MPEYYYSGYTLPESMLLENPKTVWGVYQNLSAHLSQRVAVCDTEARALRLAHVLTESGAAIEGSE